MAPRPEPEIVEFAFEKITVCPVFREHPTERTGRVTVASTSYSITPFSPFRKRCGTRFLPMWGTASPVAIRAFTTSFTGRS